MITEAEKKEIREIAVKIAIATNPMSYDQYVKELISLVEKQLEAAYNKGYEKGRDRELIS